MTNEQIIAWSILIFGWGLPLLHIILSRRAGPWRMPADAGCPISPRIGWLVMVLMLGPIGWLLFVARPKRKAS